MSLHEYIDKNGVRTRYIHVKDPEEFQKFKKERVMQDQTTRIMRQIEDAGEDVKRWNLVRITVGLAALTFAVLMVIAFWPLMPSVSMANLFGWGGFLFVPLSLFGFAGATNEYVNAGKKLRNHRRELEDLMIESV